MCVPKSRYSMRMGCNVRGFKRRAHGGPYCIAARYPYSHILVTDSHLDYGHISHCSRNQRSKFASLSLSYVHIALEVDDYLLNITWNRSHMSSTNDSNLLGPFQRSFYFSYYQELHFFRSRHNMLQCSEPSPLYIPSIGHSRFSIYSRIVSLLSILSLSFLDLCHANSQSFGWPL